MNRIDRLSAILIQLQSKKIVKAQEIADRFDISLRTVYRDIRALEEGGVPIGAEAGTGYFLMDGYHLPPVMFTQDEANALVLGAKLIEGQSDYSIERHFGEAMLKIKSVLKSSEKDELEKLESQIMVRHIPKNENEDFPNNFLATIQRALVDRSVLSFRYFSNFSGDFTSREVEPLGLIFYGNHWHLLAYCRLRKAARDFRVDRIVKLEKMVEQFEHHGQKSFDLFMEELTRGTELQEVTIAVKPVIARIMSEQKYYQGFVSQDEQTDKVVMKFLTPGMDYFSRWLLSYGNAVDILEPDSLKDMMLTRVKELKDHYES